MAKSRKREKQAGSVRYQQVKPRKLKRCSCGKACFSNREKAEEALEESQSYQRLCALLGLATNRRECRIYRCPDSLQFHLTSKEKVNSTIIAIA